MLGVALLAEGVDRNFAISNASVLQSVSPSSWRAWIEMVERIVESVFLLVALLAEGVDRNLGEMDEEQLDKLSPSSRRARIEICLT